MVLSGIGNPLFASQGVTVFEKMSIRAREVGAINLGQGFPDEDGPADIRDAAAAATRTLSNQYPPMMGIPELCAAVAEHNRRYYGLEVDATREVMVTSGATEALADCILGLVTPGDEVILIEPLYDSYLPMVKLAGGIPKLVRLSPHDWELPGAALQQAFSHRTKLIILNSPMNPCSKVFTADELSLIAELSVKYDAYAVCDEVYEHMVFDNRRHIPLMTLPGMRERCARIGSAGKTFSLTGWKVGYITAAPALLQPIAKAHQFITFTTAPNLQHGVAYGLGKDKSYFQSLADTLQAKRDRLAEGLREAGFSVLKAQGSYFITCDFRPLGFEGDDVAFCRHLIEKAGVVAIPVSAFYQDGDVRHLIRFCFCKSEAMLDQAITRLKEAFGKTA